MTVIFAIISRYQFYEISEYTIFNTIQHNIINQTDITEYSLLKKEIGKIS